MRLLRLLRRLAMTLRATGSEVSTAFSISNDVTRVKGRRPLWEVEGELPVKKSVNNAF